MKTLPEILAETSTNTHDLALEISNLNRVIARRQREGKPVFDLILEREAAQKELFKRPEVLIF